MKQKNEFLKRPYLIILLFSTAIASILFHAYIFPANPEGMSMAWFSIALLLILLIALFVFFQPLVSRQPDTPASVPIPSNSMESDPSHLLQMINKRLTEEIALRQKAQDIATQMYVELEQIFNAASPLCVIDTNMTILRYNRQFASLFNIEMNIPGLQCFNIWQLENCRTDQCPLRRFISGTPPGEYEMKAQTSPHRQRSFLVRPAPFYSPSGELKGIVASLTDITERDEAIKREKIHEEQLLQADKMASLGLLVSGVAHEINNPNTFISLNAPILKRIWKALMPILEDYYQNEGELDIGGMSFPEIRQMIPEILTGMEDGTKRINKIVGSLKDFARKDPAMLNEDVDISRVVASSLTLLNNIIRKSTDQFSVSYGPDIPTFKGNFQQIEQVVMNLVINACQALSDKSKGISITTAYEPFQKNIILTVRDAGEGIPEENLKHIFDPFFTTKRDSGGTGLGLSITSNIIKAHNGQISVDSEPLKGTIFKVIFPC